MRKCVSVEIFTIPLILQHKPLVRTIPDRTSVLFRAQSILLQKLTRCLQSHKLQSHSPLLYLIYQYKHHPGYLITQYNHDYPQCAKCVHSVSCYLYILIDQNHLTHFPVFLCNKMILCYIRVAVRINQTQKYFKRYFTIQEYVTQQVQGISCQFVKRI